MTALAQLAGEVGVAERTLRRAVNQGTLRAVRRSPHTLELPLSERRWVRRSWPLLAALRGALRTEHNVRFALLYGSVARGDDLPGSDVDVLVELRDEHLDRLADLEVKLTAIVGRRVDLLRLRDAESDPVVLASALDEGRVLVDRAGRWQGLRDREPALRRRARRGEVERAQAALEGIDRLLASS